MSFRGPSIFYLVKAYAETDRGLRSKDVQTLNLASARADKDRFLKEEGYTKADIYKCSKLVDKERGEK